MPAWPKEFISAASSNSPISSGETPLRSNQRSSCACIAESSPGISIGRRARLSGKGPRAARAIASAPKKLMPDQPSGWLNARTLIPGGIGLSAITRSRRWVASSESRPSSFHSRQVKCTGVRRRAAGSSRW